MGSVLNKFFEYIDTSHLLNYTFQKSIVPLYHVISDESIPHVENLYKIKSTKSFIADLDYLLKFFIPVTLPEFINNVENNKKIAKPIMLLTFDDGLKEFNDIISPILLRKGIPAICFLNSQFIDNCDLFYRYKVSLLIDYIHKNHLEKFVKRQVLNNYNVEKNIKDYLLSITYKNRILIDDIAMNVGLNFDNYLENVKPYLTTNHIKSLIDKGFYFGAHSIDHPLYADLSLDCQLYQTKTSLNEICSKFILCYKAFAFPFNDDGVNQQFYNEIFNTKLVDIIFGTSGLKQGYNKMHIHRIPMEKGQKSGKSIINLELSKCLIRKILGKYNALHF